MKVPQGRCDAFQLDAFQLEASTGDGYLRALAGGGEELVLLKAAFEASQPTDAVVLDVGANIGYTALTMSLLRNSAEIWAFEPSPSTFEYLKRNIFRNNCANIKPRQVAMSDKAGQVGWTQDAGDSSSAHLTPASDIVVAVSTIDEVAAGMRRQPTFIKIDVEGSELDVLKGAAKTIASGNAVLMVELNSFSLIAYGDVSPKLLIEFALDHYARVFWLGGDELKELHRNSSVLELLHTQLTSGLCVHDLLCVPAGVSLEFSVLQHAIASVKRPSRTMIDASTVKFDFGVESLAVQDAHGSSCSEVLSNGHLITERNSKHGMVAAFRRLLK